MRTDVEDLDHELTPALVHEHGPSLVAGAIERSVAESLAAYERYQRRLRLSFVDQLVASAPERLKLPTVHVCTVADGAGVASTCVNPPK